MSGGGSEVPPQPVAPQSLAEPRPMFGAEAGGSVEGSQAETTVDAPAPSASDTGVQPTAPGASGGAQGAPCSQKKTAPPSEVRIGLLTFLLIFCFSLSSDLCYFFSRKHKAASVALAPLKAVKRGVQSTPGSARPKSPPPLSREEGEPRREGEGQEMGTPRPQEPEEMVVALGAIAPLGDVDLGGGARPVQIEESQAIVASNVIAPWGSSREGPRPSRGSHSGRRRRRLVG